MNTKSRVKIQIGLFSARCTAFPHYRQRISERQRSTQPMQYYTRKWLIELRFKSAFTLQTHVAEQVEQHVSSVKALSHWHKIGHFRDALPS